LADSGTVATAAPTPSPPSALPQLILASSSPRRLALLAQIGLVPARVISPNIDEQPRQRELPRELVRRLAHAKAVQVDDAPDAFMLAADTVVAVGRRVLPKAETEAQARACLTLLSGRRHTVLTAVVLRAPNGKMAERVVESTVGFARLTEPQIRAYLASGEWHGKAGGYAIQGLAAAYIRFLSGSYSGVVGLPLFETAQLLRGMGYGLP
jgi:septum formation protein